MDINLRRTNSARRSWEGGEVSIERSKSSPSRAKPPVPKRPASIKKKPQTSVDAILESAQTGDNISPLRPVSLSLLRDTMASLPVDAQEFLFSEAEINSLSLSSGGQTEIRTNLNSDSNEKEPKLQESLAAQNHIGAVDLSRLEIRRDSGPYDNVPRNNQAPLRFVVEWRETGSAGRDGKAAKRRLSVCKRPRTPRTPRDNQGETPWDGARRAKDAVPKAEICVWSALIF
ncbi:hypothetical protein ACROYT_G003866 [Oculina patagonica]